MKNNPLFILIILVSVCGLAWYGVFNAQISVSQEYSDLWVDAKKLEEKEIYIDAVKKYERILALDPKNFDAAMKTAEMYSKLNDANGILTACGKARAIDKTSAKSYIMEADYYISKKLYAEAIKVLSAGSEYAKDKSKITELKKMLHTTVVEKYVSFSDTGDWHVQNGANYTPVYENEKWGLARKDGVKIINSVYDDIGVYSADEGVIPCCFEGEYYYIDIDGNKKLAGDKPYQFLGSFGSGFAPAQLNNIYGYIDRSFNEKHFEYQYAGAFANGVAAVKKDDKWQLIDTNFKPVTDLKFDKILLDSNNFCSLYNAVIVQIDNKYYIFDVKNKQLSKNGYDSLKLPASSEGLVAAKTSDGQWGFCDIAGNIVIEPQYEDAYSFSLNLAPVKLDTLWGYIDVNNKMVIEENYLEAKPFSSDGSAPVKKSIGWSFIVLCEFEK